MTLKPIKGVFAISPSQVEFAEEVVANNLELTGEELDTFRESGWRFIATVDPASLAQDPDAARIEPVSADEDKMPAPAAKLQKPTHCRSVYRDSAGHVVIEGGSLVVKFRPSVAISSIESVLDTCGLRIKRRLGFVENGYEVQPVELDPGTDLLELSNHLTRLGDVEYAEPATIEAIVERKNSR